MNPMHKLLLAVLALMSSSCNDFLDRYPSDELSSETMFTSRTLAESVVTGVYSNLLYDYNSGSASVVNWDSFASILDPQEGYVNLYYTYLTGTIQPNNTLFLTYWKRLYEGVNRANDVINNLSKVPDMDDRTKARRIAECRFLRAYHYYRLNALWRGVPLYEKNRAPGEYTEPRSTEQAVWRYIVEELTAVIDSEALPARYAAGDSDYGRVSRGAACALRGKAYLWLEEWALAESDFTAVGACGYDLYEGDYADLFTEENERCCEMIFSVQMVEEPGNGNALSNNYGNYCTTGYGKYQHYLNADFIDSFEQKDGSPFSWDSHIPGFSAMSPAARSVYFLRNGLTDAEKSSLATTGADMSQYDAAGNEARILRAYAGRDPRLAAIAITPYSTYVGGASGSERTYTNRYPYRDWQKSLDLRYGNNAALLYPVRKFVAVGREYTNIEYNPVDVPLIRYADVLLSLAEALNEQGKWSEAIVHVNRVRRRAGAAPLNSGGKGVKVTGSEELRRRIRMEKKWELACEQVVYLDELRWGTWKEDKFADGSGLKSAWGAPVYTYSWGGDAYYKWAVPQSEVEKAGLQQNDNWN